MSHRYSPTENIERMIEEDLMRKIRLQTEIFRTAIEACESEELPVSLQDFPRGSCSDASLLLARYLQSQGVWPLIYVSGQTNADERHQIQTHAWLEIDDIIIDITADQFDDVTQSVIVTRDRSWYQRFNVQRKEEADYYRWCGPGIDELPDAFELICSNLKDI